MDNIKTVVSEYLKDTMYECDVLMRSDRKKRLTVIMDNLRGVCGVTVITLKKAAKKVSDTTEVVPLKVKFFLLEPDLARHISKMQTEARKIDGIFSFIALRANKVRNRIYRK
tara:strand:- start:603 stop:938 length:336 start_codon:yes stop_codon:yes gene_type:complete